MGKLQCARLFIERGADLESVGSSLTSALYSLHYEKKSFPLAIEMALEVKPNLNPELLLIPAAKYGYSDSVSLCSGMGLRQIFETKLGLQHCVLQPLRLRMTLKQLSSC